MISSHAPASRNAPCPCGSGLRYKDCHGALAVAPAATPLAIARAHFDRGDLPAAASACEAVLRTSPDNPLALGLLAQCERKAGCTLPALALLLRAVRALPKATVKPAEGYAIWSSLTAVFAEALAGRDDGGAKSHREAYRHWVAQRAPGEQGQGVAVVLHVASHVGSESAWATLQTIANQTRLPAEVVVVFNAKPPALDALRARADLVPFKIVWVDAAGASKAAALEAGIASSRAPWIVILEPPHAFAPGHLAELVGGVEAAGGQWGFTDSTLVAGSGVPADVLAARQAALDATHTLLAKADTVGSAFVAKSSPAVGDGAIAFSRQLHGTLGGLRPLPGHELWDFAVRATFEDEPVHVAAATYRHAIVAEPSQPQIERENAQLAMFRGFYARACADEPPGANPHAPSLASWGFAFLRRMFQTGHVLMVDVATLERFLARIEAHEAAAPPALTPGINVIGFAYGEFGLGENLRGLVRACEAAGVPFVVNDIETGLQTREADRSVAPHVSASLRHRVSLMCANPDMLEPALPYLRRTREAGGRRVGYWYWELEKVPQAWARAFDEVDEVWCATAFIADAFRRATSKPVMKIPPALAIEPQRPYRRAEFGLAGGRFLFLFTFDYNSYVARKNPGAVIAAFRSAFPRGRADVGLVVKSVNGVRRPERVAAIDALIDGDPRITHLDRFLGRDESYGLIQACDAYISLHRSEGLGLGLAEAMALGKPAIATGYSGNLEFMNEDNSLLVAHRLVAVGPGEYLFDEPGFFWADPDVDDAARQMRRIAGDATLYERLAQAGPRAISGAFGEARAASAVRARLRELE